MTSINAHAVSLKQAERERLQADMQRFIEAGGQPYQADPNECAEWGLQMSYDSKCLVDSRKRGNAAALKARGIK